MKKIPILLFLVASLICCKKAEEEQVVLHESDKTVSQESTIELQSFKDFPKEIDGAGCFFSVDKKNLENEKYIYVDNLDSICFIKVKGNFIRLQLVEKTVDSTFKHYSQKFKNDEFELSINFKETGEDDDESAIIEGSMSVKHKNEPEVKQDLYGVCGC